MAHLHIILAQPLDKIVQDVQLLTLLLDLLVVDLVLQQHPPTGSSIAAESSSMGSLPEMLSQKISDPKRFEGQPSRTARMALRVSPNKARSEAAINEAEKERQSCHQNKPRAEPSGFTCFRGLINLTKFQHVQLGSPRQGIGSMLAKSIVGCQSKALETCWQHV